MKRRNAERWSVGASGPIASQLYRAVLVTPVYVEEGLRYVTRSNAENGVSRRRGLLPTRYQLPIWPMTAAEHQLLIVVIKAGLRVCSFFSVFFSSH